MKRIFPLLFLPIISPLTAQPLQDFVQNKLQHPVLKGAQWGGIASRTNGEQPVLFEIQPDTRLTPASTLKILTTAAALETFGPTHRFKTRLYASARPNEKGILNGDLYLLGEGDPTLGSARVPGGETWEKVIQKWVQSVKKAGISKIEGNLYADISAFEGPSVAPKVNWENMGNYYAAPVSPLNFNDNLFNITFKPQPLSGKPAEPASMEPEVPGVKLKSFVTTDSKNKKDNAYVYAAPGQYEMKIFGTIPTNLTGFSIKAALPDPALFTVQTLHKALQKSGISVNGKPLTTSLSPDYSSYPLLHTHYSPELKDILVIVNKRSFNLYAELLLRQLALHAGKKGSLKNGLRELELFLQNNKLSEPSDTVIYDGSGLARDNLLTPRTLLKVLIFMTNSPHFSYFYNSLATPDDRGDLLLLRRFLKPSSRVEQVRIKGGTLDHVKAVTGYVKTQEGELVAFVLMANNLATKNEAILRIHEDIIKKLIALPQP